MIRINIFGTTSYDVVIDNGVLDRMGEILRDELGGIRAMVVTDSNVGPHYLAAALNSLREAGYETSSITLSAGEDLKNFDNYEYLVTSLAEAEFSRSDLIVALGGGTVGDLAGFAASTFKRGMRCVQVPTSLLAAVDSSVGGKTAINLPVAKNQIGSFYNPSIVLCDPSTLTTLSDDALLDGYAEIIKYGILNGAAIIDELRLAKLTGNYSQVIAMSVNTKKDIVEMDETDNMFRQYLNLGHLIGHAIEADSDYNISHGHAVAYGLALESRACALSGYTEFSTANSISDILQEFGFELSDKYSYDMLAPYVHKDKRIREDSINVIVPRTIGECFMKKLSVPELDYFLKMAL